MTTIISELCVAMVIYAITRAFAGNSFAWGWVSGISCILILKSLGLWPGDLS